MALCQDNVTGYGIMQGVHDMLYTLNAALYHYVITIVDTFAR